MDLLLQESVHHDTPVLSVSGEVDLATAPKLRDRLMRLATQHAGQVVIVDLGAVMALDSTGLGVLVGGLRRLRATGGDLVLVVSSGRLAETMALTRLDQAFDVYDTLTGALGVIARGR